MLKVIVFICGAALMGLEFLAARMLAPTLGSSLFVWGSVISIVMFALSLGYWLGGEIADKYGAARILSPVIALAGLFSVTIPALSAAVLPSVSNLGAKAGSLAASAIVFFAPSLLLAMVSPLAVRLAAQSGIERIGRSAGSLYAISTAGSIVGTLATAFWLIPLMSLDPLVIAIGFTLFVTATLASTLPATYGDPDAVSVRRTTVLRWVTLIAVALGALVSAVTLIGPATPELLTRRDEKLLYKRDTQYHRLYVTEDAVERHLRFDRSHQSAMYLDDPFETSFKYPKYFHLAVAIKPDAANVLVVGLGGGSAVKRFWRDYPDMRIDVAEIDPVVVEVADRYFEMPDDERIRVEVEDGRRFIRYSKKTYDIIIMDAYYADALPTHLTTEEFFREAKARLAPGGVLVYNVISAPEGDKSKLFRSMYKTVSGVWDNCWVFPIDLGSRRDPEARRNMIVLATDSRMTEAEFRARIANRVGGIVSLDGFEDFGRDMYTQRVSVGDVPLLTDQHAPTDTLIDVQ